MEEQDHSTFRVWQVKLVIIIIIIIIVIITILQLNIVTWYTDITQCNIHMVREEHA